jgi:hypothetical protein
MYKFSYLCKKIHVVLYDLREVIESLDSFSRYTIKQDKSLVVRDMDIQELKKYLLQSEIDLYWFLGYF